MSSPTHEIQRLCQITPPDVGVELMVAPVHLEYLGSIENIAAAKAELIEGLKPDGTAILNADDEWVIKMRDKHQGPHGYLWYWTTQRTLPRVRSILSIWERSGFVCKLRWARRRLTLPMSGRHNLMNALAAAAVATCFDIAARGDCGGFENSETATDAWRGA